MPQCVQYCSDKYLHDWAWPPGTDVLMSTWLHECVFRWLESHDNQIPFKPAYISSFLSSYCRYDKRAKTKTTNNDTFLHACTLPVLSTSSILLCLLYQAIICRRISQLIDDFFGKSSGDRSGIGRATEKRTTIEPPLTLSIGGQLERHTVVIWTKI